MQILTTKHRLIMKTYLYLLLLLALPCSAQQLLVTGTIRSSDSKMPLPGASIVHKSSLQGITADSSGHFTISIPAADPKITVSFIGFLKKEFQVKADTKLNVELDADPNQLSEVVISSGYQDIAKERATGSFVHMDNRMLNKRISGDIISRLADNVPGLIFNRSGSMRPGAQSPISIRGQNTIFGREDPLIILDNFPYSGDISQINPNDIESVTVLKDAAAASIWGAQSSNGVIVINTKKGAFNQPVKVSLNSNVTVGARPDLFYQPVISTSDYIDMEQTLFDRGYYRSFENNDAKTALTPVVEILIAQRDGKLTADQAQQQINAYRDIDVRNDIDRYIYRSALSQQYALSVKGGGSSHRYFVSAGFDKNRSSLTGNGSNRTTLNASNTFSLLRSKLDVTTALYYTTSAGSNNGMSMGRMNIASGKPLSPYIRLADSAGNPLHVPHTYRGSFIEDAMQQGLVDWRFSPLEEIANADNTTSLTDYRLNLNANYKLTNNLSAQVLYQFNNIDNNRRNRQGIGSWYTRDLINRFTQVDANGALTRPVPIGDVLDSYRAVTKSHSLRAQLNYSGELGKSGSLSALAGAEIRGLNTLGQSSGMYGYDDEMATNVAVDYVTLYRSYVNPRSVNNRIPYYGSVTDLTDRYISYYGNAAYTYQGKYTISASARLDQSNLFGVKSNQKGVPLYSAGIGWKLSQEKFYQLPWLPYVNVRATYGYNGNIDKSLSAFTTAQFVAASPLTRVPFARVINPPNPQLRWERTKIINLAADLKTRGNRITATFEYYFKSGIDLIGDAPFAPQTGILNFRGNTANTKGHGFDLNLTSDNLRGIVSWQTTFLASYATDKVSKYLIKPASVGSYFTGGGLVPTEGRPLYAVYSYRSAGLDPVNGDPQGYLGTELSKDYNAIRTTSVAGDLVFHGSSRPLVFGALRNTVSMYGFSLSANISYRLAYFVRTPSVSYATVLQGDGGHGDFYNRWQKPGDEHHTHIPSMPAVINSARDDFYANSSALVQKGDHVRLQDIHLSYTFSKSRSGKLPFESLQLYAYANNIGLLYKKTAGRLDPDYLTSAPAARSISMGVKVDF
jgi:TonB-linked SusC/RagA family outer membrane protein